MLEMALVAPLLMALLTAITAYGGYFWMAHSLQQAANDGARAAIAGLTQSERQSIATAAAIDEVGRANGLDPALLAASVSDDGITLVLTLRYDASDSPLLRLSLVPLPDPVIRRIAVVRLGGL